jgi:hypothetical protein
MPSDVVSRWLKYDPKEKTSQSSSKSEPTKATFLPFVGFVARGEGNRGDVFFQEQDDLITESKKSCPVCKLETCEGCRLQHAFLHRQQQARSVIDWAHMVWSQNVQALEVEGLPHESAVNQATRECLSSELWQKGINI